MERSLNHDQPWLHRGHVFLTRIVSVTFRTAQLEIFRVYNSVIDHSVGGPEKIDERKLGKIRWCYKLPDWKQYYFMRNRLLMCRYTEKRFWGGYGMI